MLVAVESFSIMLLVEFVAVGTGGSCVRICPRSLQFKMGNICVFHRRKFSRVSLIGTFSPIVMPIDGNMLLTLGPVIAVDEILFPIFRGVVSVFGSGSDTM